MDNKLLLQDLTEAVAIKEGMTKKKSEAFIKALFETIEEGLLSDKFVKIKGLGTFKIISVGERESVNINTGERFFIEGHERITFTPDTSLKELVNRPFAHFQTVVINEDTDLEELESADINEKEAMALNKTEEDDEFEEENETGTTSDFSEDETGEDSNDSSENQTPLEDEEMSPSLQNTESKEVQHNSGSARLDTSEAIEQSEEQEPLAAKEEEALTTPPVTGQQVEDEDSTKIKDEEAGETESQQATSTEPTPCEPDNPQGEEKTSQGVHTQESASPTNDSPTFTSATKAEGISVPTENIEETKNMQSDNSEQQIRYIIKELENRRNIWKTIAIILLSVLLLLLSYFAGYFRWFCPCETVNYNILPSASCPTPLNKSHVIDSVARQDSIKTAGDTSQVSKKTATDQEVPAKKKAEASETTKVRKENAKTGKSNGGAAPEVKARTNEENPDVVRTMVTPPAQKPITETTENEKNTAPDSVYRQLPGGKYEIVGTQGTHRIQDGETIRTIALDVYKSKGYADYIIIHNNLENPNLVNKGMVIKLPKLVRRKK